MIKEVLNTAESKMQKTISVLSSDLTTLKAGRANPKMLDRIQVEAYGGLCPIEQVGNISAPEPRMLVITPWDKSLLKEIEKAILKSDLGINPSNDGSIIRLLVPELTEETRKNLVKNVKKLGEDAKVAIRSIRRDANEKIKALKKDGHISEDEVKKAEDNVKETEKNLALSNKKALQIIEDAKKEAEKQKQEILLQAKVEANNKMIQVQQDIEKEKQKAVQEVHDDVVNLALEASKTLLTREVNSSDNQKLLNDFVDGLTEEK